LARGQFSWKPYLKPSDIPVTVREWIDKFETHYFSKRSRNPKSQTTWNGDYKAVYSNLPQNEPLTLDLLKKAILTTTPDSRQRKRYVNALKNLGEFAELNCDLLNDLSGSYSSSKTVERNIPSDLEIVEAALLISNPQWLWAFRMMAAYGLRPHEIFHVDFSQFPILKVTRGKTGARTVYPFHPEWTEEWNLHEIQMPECTGATNRDLGSRVTKAFDRYHIPFSPYDLRHAYAVRTIRYGLDISLAAAYMGHSVKVHSDIYRKWITEETHKEAHQRLMANPNRPFPPKPKTLTKSCLKNGVELAAMSRN
jgi:integrase